ncbi:MAG: radical SAM protein, partial [Thermodesulfobacteriota bacterium]|nr:radical SAM protein [Thermodesulfobacteriota bacterium]
AENEQHLMLSLGLTTGPGCNLRCVYCYNEGGSKEAGKGIEDRMSWDDYEKAIKESAAIGAQSVVLVGVGETMMDKDFKKIIELSRGQGMIPLIFTNGSMIDKKMARFLFNNQVTIYLALDSTREAIFNLITQAKGEFPKVMRGIENCLEAGFGKITSRNGHQVTDFAINTMVMKSNIDHLEEIEQFCKDRDILFTCRFPEKLGAALDYWKSLIAATPEEEARLRKAAEKYSLGGEVFRTEHGCLFWITGVLLGSNGQARLCYSLNNKKDFGNIKKDSMRDIILKKHDIYPSHKDFFCPIHAELEQEHREETYH